MKSKKIISIVLCLTFASTLSITVTANFNYLKKNMDYKDLKIFSNCNTYSYQIFNYEKENAVIDVNTVEDQLQYYKNQLFFVEIGSSEYYEYKQKIAELNKSLGLLKFEEDYYNKNKYDEDKKLYELTLNKKYYEYCILEQQLEIQGANVNYVSKLAEVESVKLSKGQSTENDKKIKDINLELAKSEKDKVNDSIEQKRYEILNYLNQYKYTDNFSIEPEVPSTIYYHRFNVDDIYRNFKDQNHIIQKDNKALMLQEEFISEITLLYGGTNDTVRLNKNNLEIDKLNFESTCEEYKYQITKLISDYENSYSQYQSYKEYNSVIDSKIDILEISKSSGNVSDLEFLKQYYELTKEKLEYYKALINTDILYQQLCLVDSGIWPIENVDM